MNIGSIIALIKSISGNAAEAAVESCPKILINKRVSLGSTETITIKKGKFIIILYSTNSSGTTTHFAVASAYGDPNDNICRYDTIKTNSYCNASLDKNIITLTFSSSGILSVFEV